MTHNYNVVEIMARRTKGRHKILTILFVGTVGGPFLVVPIIRIVGVAGLLDKWDVGQKKVP